MLEVPSRETLAALTGVVDAVLPATALGLVRQLSPTRVSVLYTSAYGTGECSVDISDLPDALRPGIHGTRMLDAPQLENHRTRAVEWHLLFLRTRRVLSLTLAGVQPPSRLWIGTSDPASFTDDLIKRYEAVRDAASAIINQPISAAAAAERARRLELAAEVFGPLRRVLDVREVFDRLSTASKDALPHDMLTLGIFSEDLTSVTLYAQTRDTSEVARVFPQPYPAAVTGAWEFDILDDRTTHPLEKDRPVTKLGMRSSVRVAVRFDDRPIGGLAFNSIDTAKYSGLDVAIARRLADHVAIALSHHRLAERLAEQARNNEELRARATSLELLDELLTALVDTGDLPEIFGKVSAIAAKVLPHDAAALMVRLPDGVHARLYASSGFRGPLPQVTEIPPELRDNPDWEHDIFDDLSTMTDPRYVAVAARGYRSLLRVPIRLDGKFAGALIVVSLQPAAFRQADILVARRIADRLALTLARDREIQASRRADEAAARASKLEARVRALTEELDARTGNRRVIGESESWRKILKQATQVAATETTVLLLGESGTGKEVVARFLHRASPRTAGPFAAVNCAALPEQLLEAELFGYERGAYTGATQSKPGELEQAAGGTLFLDEIGEMSPSAQAKFLRVLQEREFKRLGGTRVLRADARIVAATNRDLQRAMALGQFREDLYYRLNVFAIRLPPLRDRPEDILPLSEAFLADLARGLGRPPAGISRDARKALMDYQWPGNVRELRNILERAAILCEGGLITAEYLSLSAASPAPAVAATRVSQSPPAAQPPVSSADLNLMERAMIEQALSTARFNKSRAAKALGLTRQQLYVRMRKYGIA
jgi:transcriptional regulator with GAF, ATPase, and Fis domain